MPHYATPPILVDPASGSWTQPDSEDFADRCYVVRPANRSLGSRAPVTRVLTPWHPDPESVSIRGIRRTLSPVGYEVTFRPVTSDVYWPRYAAYVDPAGQCRTAKPAWADAVAHESYFYSDDAGLMYGTLVSDVPNACVSIFTLRENGRLISAPATIQVPAQDPAPPAPTVTSVTRNPSWGTYQFSLDAYSGHLYEPVVWAAPQGQCVTTWPAGADPAAHRLSWDNSISDPGFPLPCFSVFLRNAQGAFGPPATWQMQPAPAPPTVDIVKVAHTDPQLPELFELTTHVDPDVFDVLVVARPTGQCVTSYPADEWSGALYGVDNGNGTWTYNAYAHDYRPCLTFFARNADGVFGPGTTWQTPTVATPPAPVIGTVTNVDGEVTVSATVDPKYALVAVDSPTGACAPPDPSISLSNYFPYSVGTNKWSFYTFETNPCVRFYLANVNGDLSPYVDRQL